MRVKFGLYEEIIKSGTGMYDYREFREATLQEWKVKTGDSVKKGALLALIDSEKAQIEIPALCDGVIVSLHYEEGEKWYQGDGEDTCLGRLVLPELGVMEIENALGEQTIVGGTPPETGGHGIAETPRLSPLAQKRADAENVLPKDLFSAYPHKRRVEKEDVEEFLKHRNSQTALSSGQTNAPLHVRADPAARKRARELGIEISDVPVSGEDEKIRVNDIERYAAHIQTRHKKQPEEHSPVQSVGHAEQATVIPASETRKTIARYMKKSWQEIPHAGDEMTIDVSRIVFFRDSVKGLWKKLYADDLKYDHFIMYFAAKNLLRDEFKIINAYWNEETQCIHYIPHVHLGIAVQRPAEQGLLVPVVHNADMMTFRELAENINEKVARAREGKLTLYDMRGLSFTINRVAFRDEKTKEMLGGEHPHSLIPWTRDVDGASEGRPTSMILSLSKIFSEGDRMFLRAVFRFDHRIFDGETPLRFVHALKNFVEKSSYDDFSQIMTE